MNKCYLIRTIVWKMEHSVKAGCSTAKAIVLAVEHLRAISGKHITKQMKESITRRLLEIVEDGDVTAIDLIGAFLSAGYGASRSRIQYLARQNHRTRHKEIAARAEKQRYYNLLSKLRNNQLIEKSEAHGIKTVSITEKGRDWLLASRDHDHQEFSMTRFVAEKSEAPIIIIFDIPEKRKRDRDALRNALKAIGFRMLQKSVWIGEIKIPEEFLAHLQSMRLIDYIHIFEISRSGSL